MELLPSGLKTALRTSKRQGLRDSPRRLKIVARIDGQQGGGVMGAIYGSSYYTIVDGPSWTKAEEQANALGGHLTSIGSSEENQHISRSFKDENKAYYGGVADKDIYWIGLTKASGLWKWSDGSSLNFRNWGPLEPYEDSGVNDRAEITVEAHGGPWLQSAGNWNNNSDIISPKGRYGIAEIPLSYFSIADASFREGKGGEITITRTGGTTTSQTIKVKSSDGTATTADDDYAAVDKTITFAKGETKKTISVSTTADLDVEEDETFKLTITAEGSDEVPPQISDGTATVTIKADDFKRGDSLYTIVDGPTWAKAEDNATALGGNLVTINDAAENRWIVDNYLSPNTRNFFIGATDKDSEGKWLWTSGERFNYSNWYAGEPNNADGGEDCAVA